ncbi:DUF4377 domain-containing protein [Gilvibacter sp.]|uniref:DUF4377 domain-containing protein n=1 Tax=Gilvibacter sp. TaxID=2729997 RepID=UPI0025C600F3|nr:DUF4377 domain-containing protein [Gilvibacter sp.]NQX78705.1 DUF4377 domain-containing protein [Gilvibacter sp.]
MKSKLFGMMMLAAVAFGCSSDDGSQAEDTINLFVNHFKTTSLTSLNLVLLIQEEDRIGTDQYIEAAFIEGFDFEPGFTYELTVNRIAVRNPGTEFINTRYELISVDSKTEVPLETTFTVPLTRIYPSSFYYNWIRGNTTLGFTIDGQIPIDCSGLCGPLDAVGDAAEEVRGVFRHGDEGVYVLEQLF